MTSDESTQLLRWTGRPADRRPTRESRWSWLSQGWIAIVHSQPAWTIFIVASLAVLGLGWSAARLEWRTSRLDLLNEESATTTAWQRYAREFGSQSDLVLAVGGTDQRQVISAVETLAREIESYPNHFEPPCFRVDHDPLMVKRLYQLPADDLKRLRNRIAQLTPILTGAGGSLDLEQMLAAGRSSAWASAEGPLDPDQRSTILACAQLFESLAQYLEPGAVYRSPWAEGTLTQAAQRIREIPPYFMSADERYAFVKLRLVGGGSDSRSVRASLQILRDILARLNPLYPSLDFGLTGLTVLEAEEAFVLERSLWVAVAAYVASVILWGLISHRSFGRGCAVLATVATSASWCVGVITVSLGRITLVSGSFVLVLVALATYLAIAWIHRFEHERRMGLDARAANAWTIRTLGSTWLAVAGSAMVLLLAGLPVLSSPLREACFALALGVASATAATATLLPALLVLNQKGDRADSGTGDRTMLGFVSRWPFFFGVAAWLTVAVAGAGLACWNDRAQPIEPVTWPSAGGPWQHRLLDQASASGWCAVSVANSAEEARRWAEEFRSLPSVGRVMEIASLIPADPEEKIATIAEIERLSTALPRAALNAVGSDAQRLLLSLAELAQLPTAGDGGDPIVIGRIVASAGAVVRLAKVLPPSESARRIAIFEKLWREDVIKQRDDWQRASSAKPITVKDLPVSLVSRLYGRSGKWAIQIFPKDRPWDRASLTQFRQELMTVDPEVTGIPMVQWESLSAIESEFLRWGWIVLVGLVPIVCMAVGRVSSGIWAALAVSACAGALGGCLAWQGAPIDVAALLAVPMVLTLTLAFSIPLAKESAAGIEPYRLRGWQGRPIVMTTVILAASATPLLWSSHPALVRMAGVMVQGAGWAAFGSIVLLHAMLAMATRRRRPAEQRVDVDSLPSTIFFREAA